MIAYASWFGGSGEEGILDMAVDGDGNLVVFGFAHRRADGARAFPPPLAPSRRRATTHDAFVSKFDASGSTLLFSTLIGGSGDEMVQAYNFVGGMALDAANNVYITGTTRSADFPTTAGAFDTDYNDDDAGATGSRRRVLREAVVLGQPAVRDVPRRSSLSTSRTASTSTRRATSTSSAPPIRTRASAATAASP